MIKRGQTATETIVVLAVILAVFTFIIVVNRDTFDAYDARFKIERTNIVLNDISNAAESVYQQGVGAKTKVYVSFPAKISNVSIKNRNIRFTFTNSNILERSLDFNVSGNIIVTEGRRWISLESTTDYVNISNSNS